MPLETFLKINFKLTLFDRKYVTLEQRTIYDYKLKAITRDWCKAYNILLKILFIHGKRYPAKDWRKENDENNRTKYPKLFASWKYQQTDAFEIIEKI